jgi:hypothetical protein
LSGWYDDAAVIVTSSPRREPIARARSALADAFQSLVRHDTASR